MTATHDEQGLVPAYVLGALEPPERRAFEAHAAGCAACRDEVRSLRRVTDALALSVPQHTPPAALRDRVLTTAAGRDAVSRASLPARRSSGMSSAVWLPLAASLLVAAGLGMYAVRLQGRVSTLERRLGDAEGRAAAAERSTMEARQVATRAQGAMAVLAAPDLTRIELAGRAPAGQARARALWSRSRGMVFTAANLPPAPEGRVYQVWVVTAERPISAGLIELEQGGRAIAYFQTPENIPAPTAVAVTLEPAGGVPAPTGEMYLLGSPTT